jgi:septal ring factor EnvC (AmiA/AmiB activator)
VTTSVADDDRPTAGITLPMWALGIIGTVLTASAAWVSSSFFSLRDDTIRMNQRIEVVERDLRKAEVDSKGTPASLASMSSDIKSIKESMADLRDEVRRLSTGPKGR